MEKPLKPTPHGVADYVWAGTMIAAPWVFGFRRNRAATINAVAAGAAHLGLSLFTRYPLGVAKVIPFKVHGMIEASTGAFMTAAPWLLGFANDERARAVHLAAGLGTFGVVAATDYEAADPSDGLRELIGPDEDVLEIEAGDGVTAHG
jgi:hypothetical protein